jgi:dGTPase
MIPMEQVHLVNEREKLILAPYAMFSRDSLGRDNPEQEHPYRGPFQRDRDRILHSSAYRRLRGKMQVFTGEMGDYHRTRLTHTQEVATIARTIGRSLRLNEDLIEALALVHDIGHPPYGHAGEDVLDECIKDHGGFSHNQFALTIVQELEIRYAGFQGLNLTREVLAGQTSRIDKSEPRLNLLLEVQLVDAADSTTYDAHDTDDAVKLGLVTLEEMAELSLIKESLQFVRSSYTNLSRDLLRKSVVHRLINRQVTDMFEHCSSGLEQRNFQSAHAATQSDFRIQPSSELAEQKKELEKFLYARVYRHPQLVEVREKAQQRLREMFDGYCKEPILIPTHHRIRIEKNGLERTAAEYIAGMTDKFCEDTFNRHFAGNKG